MVKRKSCLASNEMVQVRILVGPLTENSMKRKGYPIGDGSRLEAGRAMNALRVRLSLLPLNNCVT